MVPTRRSLLTATVVSALAGCTAPDGDGSGDGGGASPTDQPDSTAPGETATPDAPGSQTETRMPDDTPTPPADDLDLREANVTAVERTRSGGDVRFDVTLYHDDDGENGYADWWQVERLDGSRLGRRVLTHPHSTSPFTRSDTYGIPDDVACVVVRGHDQTHGYGGQAALVNLETGAVRLVRQGSDPRSFSEADCP